MAQYAYFSELPLNTEFFHNGNKCKKASTKTAVYVEYGRKFYFHAKDLCRVGNYSRLAANYHVAAD